MDSTITAKGQTTIPKEVRDTLGLKAGDKVKYFVLPTGQVYMLPVTPASALRGVLKGKSKRRRPVSVEEMGDAARKEAVARYRRSSK